jgi:uncharacterized protein
VIGYLDTSAFVPLLVAEPGSRACRRFWDDADEVVSCRLLYVEAASALAQAHRLMRLTRPEHDRALGLLRRMWNEIDVVEIDQPLVGAAAELAARLALRGYDAVHCASAEQVMADDLVAASGDRRLLSAWQELGIATYDINVDDP